MKLFLYYATHTFKNQIKKLCKTWILVFFLVCALLGGLIGFGIGAVEDSVEATPPETPEIEEQVVIPEGVTELAVGGVLLLLLGVFVVSADKSGSKIFQPADVTLLFASPMKPQSVLLFRLTTQLGTVLVSTLYMSIQMPNLMQSLGLSGGDAAVILCTWFLAVAVGQLLATFLYLAVSSHPKRKPYLRRGLYLVLLVVAGLYILSAQRCDGDYLAAAISLFNHPVTRYVPIWGWLKGLCVFAIEDNLAGALLCLGAVLASGGLLWFFISRIKTDFYEEALQKTEEIAAQLEVAQTESSVGFVKRKKDRSDRIRRDGLHRGLGASVFFHRIMYNRFRFAHLGFLTKTMETYLVAALGVAAICRFGVKTDTVYPLVFVLAGLAFFRSLGNPLGEDTAKHFFLMAPDPIRLKLWYSLLGGLVGCLLDLLPAILAGGLLLGVNPLALLVWLPFILSMDFFATNVAAFINFSVPVSAGKLVKQLVMILFVYFGMIPDAIILVVGFLLDGVSVAVLLASLFNVGIGLLFFVLLPLFLEPPDQAAREKAVRSPQERREARRAFSRMGFATLAVFFLSTVLQMGVGLLAPGILSTTVGFWLATFAPIYLVGFPVGWLMIRRMPRTQLIPGKAGGKRMTVVTLISIFMMYAGNMVGILISWLATVLTGIEPQAPVLDFATSDALVFKLLFMVILAPLLEEFFFRKLLIDRMSRYGEGLSVVVSAAMFGLFHGNLNQMFYAFSLGLVFGYIYLKTGRLRYSVGLHMGLNLLGGVVAPWLLEQLNDAPVDLLTELLSPAVLLMAAYSMLMMSAAVTGLVLLCVNARNIRFTPAPQQLGKERWGTVLWNPGMLLFLLTCLGMVALTFL